ncbi:hypothetical protein U9M48_007858, partial [Paspalum notatum var. saurae]
VAIGREKINYAGNIGRLRGSAFHFSVPRGGSGGKNPWLGARSDSARRRPEPARLPSSRRPPVAGCLRGSACLAPGCQPPPVPDSRRPRPRPRPRPTAQGCRLPAAPRRPPDSQAPSRSRQPPGHAPAHRRPAPCAPARRSLPAGPFLRI